MGTNGHREHWFVTADERGARLFSSASGGGGRLSIQQLDDLVNLTVVEHEHQRPSILGRGPSRSAMQHYAGTGHQDEEARHRFARPLAHWLAAHAFKAPRGVLDVFIATRMLGELRPVLEHQGQRITLHQAELTRLSPGELAVHPSVLSLHA
ncbi:MAG: host attachment protein [Phycisphaeraceae bacterium]|nr:host attachment protein [Phycisphaeraceae bacterium]